MRFPFLRAALALGALAFIPLAAHASMIASLGSVTPASGGFRFSYNVSFDGSNFGGGNTITLEPGDFFTIYDFAGFISGTNLQPADWTFSSALTGTNPFGTTPPDDPAVPNLTWNYGGASRITDGSLGAFSAVSVFGGTASDFFAAENTQTLAGIGEFPSSNVLPVSVPAPAAAVPEPGTLALLALGLLPLLGVVRQRRRIS